MNIMRAPVGENRRMTAPDIPLPADTRGRWLRTSFLVIVALCATVLIPWIGYLIATLPRSYLAGHWRAAWVGFDVGLVVVLVMTGWTAWRRRRSVVTWCAISGALLICDAWFDVVLAWGTSDAWVSVAAAVLAELPLAAMMFFTATRLIGLMLARASTQSLGSAKMHGISLREVLPRRPADSAARLGNP